MTIDYTRPPTPPPPPPPPPGTPGVPPQQGFNWSGCLKACGIGCGILLVLFLVGLGGIFVFVFQVIKSSDVYRGAMQRAQNDPRVVAALGTPIESSWWVMGSVHIDNDGGYANIDIPIHGPKGKGTIDCVADRINDQWRYKRLNVIIGGQTIDLLNAPPGQNVRIQRLQPLNSQVLREAVHDM